MTERTRAPHARPADGRRAPEETADEGDLLDRPTRSGWSNAPLRVRVALLLSMLGAALAIAGPALGLVKGQPAAGFAAMPLLIVLAVLPPLLAVLAIIAGRPVIAAGVLIGFALLTPGRALMDLQFAVDALLTARPELLVPTNLAPLTATTGLWVLLAGHLLAAAAGLLATGSAGAEPGSAYAEQLDDAVAAPLPTAWRFLVGGAIGAAAVVTIGLFRPAFQSHNAFQLSRELVDSPGLVRTGGLLVVAAVALGCVFAASSTRPTLARGVLLGVLMAVAGVLLPGMVAGLAVDRLSPTAEPYFALAAVALLTVAVFLRPGAQPTPAARPVEPRLEAGRLQLVGGVLGIATGIAAVIAGVGSQLVVDGGLEQPVSYANRQLVPAGLLVALLGGALLVRRWSALVRPAFTVALAAVPVVGASALDAALTGTEISSSVHVGFGVWFAGLAMIIAVLAAVLAGIAGTAERDDVDLTEHRANLAVIIPVAVATVLAVGGFGLPAVKAPDFVAPGIWSEFRLTSWGLLLGLLVVVAVGVLAPVSRPVRAAALLLGAASVVGVRLLEFPLTSGRAEEATAGAGTWLSLACLAALLIAAVIALFTRPRASVS